ncbi:Antibiotic biosynthesis monooxygenase [Ruegeria denitrificans]|uniref:Antibiotic biosynthesis monooxygenase n=1 Tax=Ruegeria denitrificans TaxID=1715692 RepID=A0A0P1I3D6_9RHOB|nr:putative quinol monooxygenase [Ruegeria denitrificans]CUJ88056.1 Antibiotic biosynthesis monooxygenase [Ruegeria denitrificans]
MANGKIYLRGFILVPADRLEQVRAALPRHIALTRAEPGCLSFEVAEDTEIAGRFNVSEVFENRTAFDAHQVRTKASDWFHVTKGIPREYSITSE